MKKPTWFRVLDLFTIGLGGLVALGLVAYILIAGVDNTQAKEGLYLLAAVGVCFSSIWGKLVYDRYVWLSKFIWYPRYGLMIDPGNYIMPYDSYLVDTVVKRTIEAWSKYYPSAEKTILSEVTWVWFSSELDQQLDKLAGCRSKGYTISNTHSFFVDYNDPAEALEATAFEHELGHVIRGNATGVWGQELHHQFIAEHGLK